MSLPRDVVVRATGDRELLHGVPGVEYAVRLSGADTGGDLAVVEISVAPGAVGASPHVHRGHSEHFHVLEGEVTFDVGDDSRAVGPDTWVSVPRLLRHGFRNETDVAVRLVCVLSPAGYEGYFRDVDRLVVRGQVPDAAVLAALRSAYNTDSD